MNSVSRSFRWLLVPPFIFLLVTVGFALVAFVTISFFPAVGMGLVGNSFTLKNYQRLLDLYYLEILAQTVIIAGLTTVGSALFSYPIALLITNKKTRWSTACLIAVLASSAMSLVVRALGWIGILTDGGLLNILLGAFGINTGPLHILGTNFAVVLGLVHGFIPLFVLTLIPVLAAIDPNIQMAAAGLGANDWTIFRKVTFPLSLPGLIAACLLVFAMCMGAYTTPALLSAGRTLTFPMLIQQQIVTVMNYPMGAALAFVLLVLVLWIIWTSMWLTHKAVYGARGT
jgi:ABC-type spermidine/putrescine transport system permease subunit I